MSDKPQTPSRTTDTTQPGVNPYTEPKHGSVIRYLYDPVLPVVRLQPGTAHFAPPTEARLPRFLHRLLRRPQPATNHEIAAWLYSIRDELGFTCDQDSEPW